MAKGDLMGDLFLGVDGGGTGCRVRLVDAAGRRLGDGKAGAANIRLGLDVSWGRILNATDQALAEAGLDRSALPRIHAGLGLAGITGPADSARVTAGAPGFASVAAETDAHTACLGAFGGRDGAILILGLAAIRPTSSPGSTAPSPATTAAWPRWLSSMRRPATRSPRHWCA